MYADAIYDGQENELGSMDDPSEQVRWQVLSQYEETGAVDLAALVDRYPEQRDEIVEFYVWVVGSPLADADDEPDPGPAVLDEVAEKAFQNACLSVNLGPQWLEATFDADGTVEDDLGRRLAEVRSAPYQVRGKASPAFRKAAVLTWTVSVIGQRRERVTRLATQKCTYLLEQALELNVFTEYHRKKLGPYDYKARYKDAEPIAIKSGWLEVQGTVLRAASDLSQLRRYVSAYLRSEPLATQFLQYLAALSDEQLETLATVHSAALSIAAAGSNVTVDAICRNLAATPEWHGKLNRPNFSTVRIAEAVAQLARLRLVQGA